MLNHEQVVLILHLKYMFLCLFCGRSCWMWCYSSTWSCL